jgi:hypothetical protein
MTFKEARDKRTEHERLKREASNICEQIYCDDCPVKKECEAKKRQYGVLYHPCNDVKLLDDKDLNVLISWGNEERAQK